jgi:hypothetical protein
VFCNIPRDAIISTFGLGELISLADHNTSVANLLSLEMFRPDVRTLTVSSQLSARNVMLNTTSAQAMALVCLQFFLSSSYKLVHIQELVARIVDGFRINRDASQHLLSCGIAFAVAFNSGAYRLQDVAKAFVEGLEMGWKAVEFYTRRKRPATR